MAGVPMVQPAPLFKRKPVPHGDIHSRKHYEKLPVASFLQRLAIKRESLMLISLILSFIPFAYYVLTGSESALMIWICMITFGMMF
jgi:hypothetical protein